ncbi:hypothetical protein NPIL_427361 [Nephila pilipes]|uniref:Secreted protein n=1 Tax=Nephila pilipes TaxID=299642 RepID=A0A8X6M565_NEPPI|nr:hypothetical protein NPIL_427361 [Nephila pilipes]
MTRAIRFALSFLVALCTLSIFALGENSVSGEGTSLDTKANAIVDSLEKNLHGGEPTLDDDFINHIKSLTSMLAHAAMN